LVPLLPQFHSPGDRWVSSENDTEESASALLRVASSRPRMQVRSGYGFGAVAGPSTPLKPS
jgi:hypothetical protein